MKSTQNRPRDEFSKAAFEADAWVRFLPDEENNHKLRSEADLFGIVLVANWPPNECITQPYCDKFLPKVKEYFDDEDFEPRGEHRIPAVYLYPPYTLHITIATFTPFTAPELDNRDAYAQACASIMKNASSRKDWPNRKFSIEVDRVHVGAKAGILLWNNSDGVVGVMRKIIQEEYDIFNKSNPSALHHRELIVPNIIHTTFMRFGHSPKAQRQVVQEMFTSNTKHTKECFGKIEVNSIRLAVERIPYMHIPNDERHVLSSYEMHNC